MKAVSSVQQLMRLTSLTVVNRFREVIQRLGFLSAPNKKGFQSPLSETPLFFVISKENINISLFLKWKLVFGILENFITSPHPQQWRTVGKNYFSLTVIIWVNILINNILLMSFQKTGKMWCP